MDRLAGNPVPLTSEKTKVKLPLRTVVITLVIAILSSAVGYYLGSQIPPGNVLAKYENTTYAISNGQAYQNLKLGLMVVCQKRCQMYRACDATGSCKESECKDWPSDTLTKLQSAAINGAYVQVRDCAC